MKTVLCATVVATIVLGSQDLRAQQSQPGKVSDKMIEGLINAVTPEAGLDAVLPGGRQITSPGWSAVEAWAPFTASTCPVT